MTSIAELPPRSGLVRVGSGELPPVPLGTHLVLTGLITEEELERALEEQRVTGRRLGGILVDQHALLESDLARMLAEQNGLPYRDLDVDPPDPGVSDSLPEAFCRRHSVLPVELEDGSLVVAISDPLDLQTFDDLRTLTSLPLVPVLATKSDLRHAIESIYSSHLLEETERGASPVGGREQRLTQDDALEGPSASGNDRLVVELVNQVLQQAIVDRASDIHLEPAADSLRIRFRVDGMLRDVMSAPVSVQHAVTNRIKILADMDISDHRRPQDGRLSIDIGGHPVDLRAATIPTIDGEALVLRILVKDTGLLHMDSLGFSTRSLRLTMEALRKASGLVLVTGPTGSGKSTTLYAAINELNSPSRNTVTVEDPIEYRLAGIKQTQVDPRAGYTFASGLRAVLRTDPDILLVGEIRDFETARIASEAALTGHLVLSTLHANNAASSTTRLLDMGLPPYLVTSTLQCVVAQRLIRRLCPLCRSAEAATAEELLELVEMGLVPSTATAVELPRANGCDRCGRTGYRGRLAVHEVMAMDEQLRTLVLQNSPAEAVAATAIANGMQTLRMDAFAKVRDHETTLDELKRLVD